MVISKVIKHILVTVVAIFVMILALYAFAVWYISSGVFTTDTFDKKVWSANTSNEEDTACYRGGMAKDIIDSRLTNNMSKENVIALLGNPDKSLSKQEFEYVLGMCSGFGFDYDNLHIYFNEQDNFSHAKIIQH